MAIPDVVTRYFQGWNDHDADAIVATFAPAGTYEDSATRRPLTGDAIGAYAAALWDAFPDLRFDFASEAEVPGGVAAQWIMRGTNSGSFQGLPPTGKSVVLSGADFITVANGCITSVRGYFDTAGVPQQLGLQVIVQPERVGPFAFGKSVFVEGKRSAKPGAFSVTVLRSRDEQDVANVREYSRKIAAEFREFDGFLGTALVTVAGRMITVTAWENADQPREMARRGTHKEAMPRFYGGPLGTGGFTSVWVPDRINPLWVRCTSCGQMAQADTGRDSCRCGAMLPAAPGYF